MQMRELRYVIAIDQFRSISIAAKSLGVTQPALSKYLKTLEEQLDVKLFTRAVHSLVPTEAGQIYIESSKNMLDVYDRMAMDISADDRQRATRLRLGITIYRGSILLPRILPAFQEMYPNIELVIVEESAPVLENMLAENRVDLIIVKEPISFVGNMKRIPLFEEETLLCVPDGWPVAEKAVAIPGQRYPWLDLRLLKDERFILLKKGQRTRLVIDQILTDAGVVPKHCIETANIFTALEMSVAGLGVTLLPELYAAHAGDGLSGRRARFFSASNPPFTSLFSIVHHEGGYLSNHIKALIQIVVDYYSRGQIKT